MDVLCYQMVGPPGRVRLWIGAHPTTAPPTLEAWRVDGAPANVETLRPMQSVRDATLLEGNEPRAFSGVFDITGVNGPASLKIQVTVGGRQLERAVKVYPTRLELDGSSLTVLLVSCFHYDTYGPEYAEWLPRVVRGQAAPDFSIFMGDQVYLDLPTLQNFHEDTSWLGKKFEADYVRNWFAGDFPVGLQLAPVVFVPDDHEYWNNFPHPSPFIQNSWSDTGQKNWRRAANACYSGFQLGVPALGDALEFDVEPLSFLILDTRSARDVGLTRLLSPGGSEQLQAWATRVTGDPRLTAGVVVTGQSLLEDPVGAVKGSIADYSLANYAGAYTELLTALGRVGAGGKQVLLLTGDVHWGRVTSVRDRQRDAVAFYEVISSPASLVATVGTDQVADTVNAVKKWFGAGDPWPRHSEANAPPNDLPLSNRQFRTGAWQGQRGNHVVLLRFTRRAAGVLVEYEFLPLARAAQPGVKGQFQMQPTG